MPSFISYSPLETAPKATVCAPERLHVKASRKQQAGKRLLGFVVRMALQSKATDLYMVATSENLLAVSKVAEQWNVAMDHASFHAFDILDAIEELSPSGFMTVEQNGVATVWKVAFARVSGGEEVFLNRVA